MADCARSNRASVPCPPSIARREGIKIISDHPALNAFPHAGYVDVQFYGLAADWALQPDALLAALSGVSEVRPLLRRLDARQFILTDYLIEARVGSGRLIVYAALSWRRPPGERSRRALLLWNLLSA
jgi:hypothetical protein